VSKLCQNYVKNEPKTPFLDGVLTRPVILTRRQKISQKQGFDTTGGFDKVSKLLVYENLKNRTL
jgi:hypothetical protein